MWVPSITVTLRRILLEKLLYSYQFLTWLFLIRITTHSYVLKPLCWNSKIKNKMHAIEPRVNLINFFYSPRQDECIFLPELQLFSLNFYRWHII